MFTLSNFVSEGVRVYCSRVLLLQSTIWLNYCFLCVVESVWLNKPLRFNTFTFLQWYIYTYCCIKHELNMNDAVLKMKKSVKFSRSSKFSKQQRGRIYVILNALRFPIGRLNRGGMITRWPHQKTSNLDEVIARTGT